MYENVLENTYIFDLMNNVEYVAYALYSSIDQFWVGHLTTRHFRTQIDLSDSPN
jgi:hypothetical protein